MLYYRFNNFIIKKYSLIASISRSFRIGALMTLYIGGQVGFKLRIIEETPEEEKIESTLSLLDGQ